MRFLIILLFALVLFRCTSPEPEKSVAQLKFNTEVPQASVDSLDGQNFLRVNLYNTQHDQDYIVKELASWQEGYNGDLEVGITTLENGLVAIQYPGNVSSEWGNYHQYGHVDYFFFCSGQVCEGTKAGYTLVIDTMGNQTHISRFDQHAIDVWEFCEVPLYFKDGRKRTKYSCRPEMFFEFPFPKLSYEDVLKEAGVTESMFLSDKVTFEKVVFKGVN